MMIAKMNVTETGPGRVTIALERDGEVVLRRECDVLDLAQVQAASEAVALGADWALNDADAALQARIGPIRMKILRQRENGVGLPGAGLASSPAPGPEARNAGGDDPDAGPGQPRPRYRAVLPDANDPGRPVGTFDLVQNRRLGNFVVLVDEEVEVRDHFEPTRRFAGRIVLAGRSGPFAISATDYADNAKLKAALFEAGGVGVVVEAGMDDLRRAITEVSAQAGPVRQRVLTTDFGWTADRTAYLTPDYKITAAGVDPIADGDVRVDLGGEVPACRLGLKRLDPVGLARLKRHVVEDLLPLGGRVASYALLAAVAAAVLYPFIDGAGRFALWLIGLTGSGKSLVVKLFANFFGDFPVGSGAFATWASTANFLQRQGYFCKDALYVVDDYKPEVVSQYQAVRVLQGYADSAARGRLNADATANVLRPIRGLLVCTGEDLPEHSASAVARSVVIRVGTHPRDMARKERCLAHSKDYSGVTADFIRWLLAEDRIAAFQDRFRALESRYQADVAGRQNDARVAANLAQLGAGFELIAEYLADAWPAWQDEARRFVSEDLVAIREDMLGEARDQQASEVFMQTLGDLARHGHVRFDGPFSRGGDGVPIGTERQVGRPGERPEVFLSVNVGLALGEVNTCLRSQGRAELKVTARALIQQLREDGVLRNQDGSPLPAAGGGATGRIWIGEKQVRAVTVARGDLIPDGGEEV